MRSNRIIRPLLAGVLLALFALGVTPRLAIHALVAHHTDTHLALKYGQADQLNKSGFHCATDNLVVECPFLDHSLTLELGLPPAYPAHRAAILVSSIAKDHPLFGLRGPPAVFSFC